MNANAQEVIRNTLSIKEEYEWIEVITALRDIVSEDNDDNLQILLDVLRFSGEFRIKGETCHNMSPEDMTKSLAVQALCRWSKWQYIDEIEKINYSSPVLSGIIQIVVKIMKEEKKKWDTIQRLSF